MNIFNLLPIMLIATGVLGIIFIVLGFTGGPRDCFEFGSLLIVGTIVVTIYIIRMDFLILIFKSNIIRL